MTQEFDPYHVWLGIPPTEQPPDHYRLLGVRQFEDVADVIQNAADQRMLHVRTFQSGVRGTVSQQILNEIATASRVLLTPQSKANYDFQLQQQAATAQQPPMQTPAPAAPSPAPPGMFPPAPASQTPAFHSTPTQQMPAQQRPAQPATAQPAAQAQQPRKMDYRTAPPRWRSSLPFVIVGGLLGIVTAFGIASFVTQTNVIKEIFGNKIPSRQSSVQNTPANPVPSQSTAESTARSRPAARSPTESSNNRTDNNRSTPAASARRVPSDSQPERDSQTQDRQKEIWLRENAREHAELIAETNRIEKIVKASSYWNGTGDMRLSEVVNQKLIASKNDIRIEGKSLFLQSTTRTNILLFQVNPGPAYNITTTVKRLEGSSRGLNFGLIVGNRHVDLSVDEFDRAGLELLDNERLSQRRDSNREDLLPVGRARSIRIAVAPGRVSLFVSGKRVAEETFSASQLSSRTFSGEAPLFLSIHSRGAPFRVDDPRSSPAQKPASPASNQVQGATSDSSEPTVAGSADRPEDAPQGSPAAVKDGEQLKVARTLSARERRANLAVEKMIELTLREIKQRDYTAADDWIKRTKKHERYELLKRKQRGLQQLNNEYQAFWKQVLRSSSRLKQVTNWK